jgi:hypothetical protein
MYFGKLQVYTVSTEAQLSPSFERFSVKTGGMWVEVMECEEAESQRSNSVQKCPEAIEDLTLEAWGADLRHSSVE